MAPVNKCGNLAFCALCYSGAKGRRAYKGHYGYYKPAIRRETAMAKFLRPLSREDDDSGPSYEAPEPGKLLGRLEALFEFLTLAKWDDDTLRERGTLIVFVEDACFKGMLSDKDSGRIAFLSGGTFEDLLVGLDRGLREDSLDWRRKKEDKPVQRKKK